MIFSRFFGGAIFIQICPETNPGETLWSSVLWNSFSERFFISAAPKLFVGSGKIETFSTVSTGTGMPVAKRKTIVQTKKVIPALIMG